MALTVEPSNIPLWHGIADEADDFASALLVDLSGAGHTGFSHGLDVNDEDLDYYKLNLAPGLHHITIRPDVRLIANTPQLVLDYMVPGLGIHPGVQAQAEVNVTRAEVYEKFIYTANGVSTVYYDKVAGLLFDGTTDTLIGDYFNSGEHIGNLITSRFGELGVIIEGPRVSETPGSRFEYTGEYYLVVESRPQEESYLPSGEVDPGELSQRYQITLEGADERDSWGADWLDRYDYATGERLPTPAMLSVGNAEIVEGTNGAISELVFTVHLSTPSTLAVTVNYETQPGTATAGALTTIGTDYKALSGTLTFEPGQTSREVRVEVRGDSFMEGDETLKLVLAEPSNAEVSRGIATGTIREDDGISLVGTNVIEPTTIASKQYSFTIRLTSPAQSPISVSYKTEGLTAVDNSDFIGSTGRVTFEPGQQVKTFTVDILRDGTVEAEESFNLVLFAPEGAPILTETFTVKILDPEHVLPAPPPAIPKQSVLLPEDSFAPPVSIGSPDHARSTTPGFIPDASGERFINVDTDKVVDYIRAGREALVEQVGEAAKDFTLDKMRDWAVKQAPIASFLDMYKRVAETKKFVDDTYKKNMANLMDLLDQVVEERPEEEAEAKFQELDDNMKSTQEEGSKLFLDQVWDAVTDSVREWAHRSDLTFLVDVDPRDFKADLIAGPGHRDAILGSTGDDRMFLGDLDDVAWGSDGNDALHGEDGDDRLGGSFGDDLLSGGAGFDLLVGGEGSDSLDGGQGADRMIGGKGNDVFAVDDAGDEVVEAAAGGTDEVQSAASYTLGANVENLTLTGNAAIDGTGNGLANSVTGNDAANVLNGGAGADTMQGAAGNDTYLVDHAGDQVIEASDAGIDHVRSSVSFALGANVENLTLTGAAAINGIGNFGDNVMVGNDAANTLDGGGAGLDILQGGLGNDIYFVDGVGDVVTEAAAAGTDTVQSSGSFTLGANIENLILNGASTINGTGNGLANILTGNGAANTLNGGAGVDTMSGGLGNDSYVVDNALDKAVEAAGAGTDKVTSSASFTLGVNVENLILAGATAINGTGNTLANTILGNDGDNFLDGGTGADTLQGGLGNDSYVVDHASDKVIETSASGGADKVTSSVSFALGTNVENLILTGSTAINGTGNGLANSLTGNDGNNSLNGSGGADTMSGGLGNDRYGVDNVGDVAIETNSTGGNDGVTSTVSFTLGANIENLVLVGTAALNGTGNTLANLIIGNAGANLLDGKAGADTMQGGLGHDTYVVDDALDKVIETSPGGGVDKVTSSVSFSLGTNVEQLILTGTAAINGTGNGLANAITGNDGANVLNGGIGADTLTGGNGDDAFVVDNALDKVIETSTAGGIDRVTSSVSFTLGGNVENLTLAGSAAINGTGNTLANILLGNGAANLLDGAAGADTMQGGLGSDTYVVDNVLDKAIETSAAGGTDLVRSSASFTLGANVENLVLLGSAVIDGTGNSLANNLVGNASANQLSGGGGNDWLDGAGGNDVLTGGAGDDVFIVDRVGDQVSELANGGRDTVRSAIAYRLGEHVEDLVLTGAAAIGGAGNTLANRITGNAAANRLDGGDGNDRLDGGAGGDTMIGGAGDDVLVVDSAGDAVVESAEGGHDIVEASLSHALAAEVEELVLTGAAAIGGTGNALANRITGNAAANSIDGSGGDDQLDGGGGNDTLVGGTGKDSLDGGAGADVMSGGADDDTYVVDDGADQVQESAGQGQDMVLAAVTYGLAAEVEKLVLTGIAAIDGTGNALANEIVGNDAANRLGGGGGGDLLEGGGGTDTLDGEAGDDQLEGGAGIDTLNGGVDRDQLDGGAGADAMSGGAGDDDYVVDDAADLVIEAAGQGNDTVRGAINVTLAANVEALELLGSADVNGTGNGLANRLTGNGGANRLEGGDGADTFDGGSGVDTLVGGAGDDLYLIDPDDLIIELSGGGTDSVVAAFDHVLAAEVENLTLVGAAIDGTGNALGNRLVGNAFANTLDGLGGNDQLDGGTGADLLKGGQGDDSYWIDDIGDRVEELAGLGIDTVHAALSTQLGGDVENLVLEGGALDGTGNALDNRIDGNAGNNRLDGGAGIDTLSGGAGDDTYVVDAQLDHVSDGAGHDTVISSADQFFLANASGIEDLVLTGTGRLGEGHQGSNRITGSNAANEIYGGGGADVLIGGGGNDFVASGRVADNDTIGDLIDGGAGNDTLAGQAGQDHIHGGTGNDLILTGSGADRIYFETALSATSNVDTISTGPSGEEDRLVLDRAIFTALAPGEALSASAFRTGAAALDADDRIIFNPANSALSYDADGSGAMAAIQFATMQGMTSFSAAQFIIIG